MHKLDEQYTSAYIKGMPHDEFDLNFVQFGPDEYKTIRDKRKNFLKIQEVVMDMVYQRVFPLLQKY